jgi:PKHD-type hydroxylase
LAPRASPGGRARSEIGNSLRAATVQSLCRRELTVEDTYGAHMVELPPGDSILYLASSLHHVTPVTSDERVASFFWIRSMVRDDARRRVLFDMDVAVQRLVSELGQAHASVVV